MSDVVFARTRWHYAPYDDWFKLAELSGYPVVWIDDIPAHGWQDKTVIFHWFGVAGGVPQTDARKVLWQTEWIPASDVPPGLNAVWYMDAGQGKANSGQYVPIGSHEGLRAPGGVTQWLYDVAFVGYREPYRRLLVLNQLEADGVRIAPNGWGDIRHRSLLRSRAMLHIHQHDTALGVAGLRVALAAAYRLPYISEAVEERGIFSTSNMLFSSHEYLADFTRMWVRDEHLTDYGMALHGLLCRDYTFKKGIEAAL